MSITFFPPVPSTRRQRPATPLDQTSPASPARPAPLHSSRRHRPSIVGDVRVGHVLSARFRAALLG